MGTNWATSGACTALVSAYVKGLFHRHGSDVWQRLRAPYITIYGIIITGIIITWVTYMFKLVAAAAAARRCRAYGKGP